MEVLSPYDSLDEGEWMSPRISFSQDCQLAGKLSPKMQFKDSPASEEEFSFNFSSSVDVDLPTDHSMLSADELFFNGKLRPLHNGIEEDVGHARMRMSNGRNIEDNPRCFSMTIESCRGGGYGSRAYMSLHNSRCSSPSRTMSMPRTTPTSPKAPASISSSSSSRAPISSGFPSSSSSVIWMSSSVITPSKYSSKLKEFFKLKKTTNMSKDLSVPAISSAEISRECPHSSGSASCRHPSRSFWPFSRSNSAGESKSAPVVSPLPRRSNSAGEGKTTSSSLLPTGTGLSKQQAPIKDLSLKSFPSHMNPTSNSSSSEPLRSNPAMAKKGLPPLPNISVKKTSSFFATAHCGSDAAIVSSQHITSSPSTQAFRNSDRTSSGQSMVEAEALQAQDVTSCTRENGILSDAENRHDESHSMMDANLLMHKGKASMASPVRQVKRGSHGNASRNFARSSPGRRGVWASPGRGNGGGRVSIRSLDRGSVSSYKGHVRPKDMLSRDGTSVRISPVLNVGVPSLRGSKAASSKSKMFSLGNLFTKRERGGAGGGLQAPLPGCDSQNGG